MGHEGRDVNLMNNEIDSTINELINHLMLMYSKLFEYVVT